MVFDDHRLVISAVPVVVVVVFWGNVNAGPSDGR